MKLSVYNTVVLVLLGHKRQANRLLHASRILRVYDAEIIGFSRSERGL